MIHGGISGYLVSSEGGGSGESRGRAGELFEVCREFGLVVANTFEAVGGGAATHKHLDVWHT